MIFKIYSFASRRWNYLFISRQGIALEEEFSNIKKEFEFQGTKVS